MESPSPCFDPLVCRSSSSMQEKNAILRDKPNTIGHMQHESRSREDKRRTVTRIDIIDDLTAYQPPAGATV